MITWLMQRRRNHTRNIVAVKKGLKKAEIEAVGGHGGSAGAGGISAGGNGGSATGGNGGSSTGGAGGAGGGFRCYTSSCW